MYLSNGLGTLFNSLVSADVKVNEYQANRDWLLLEMTVVANENFQYFVNIPSKEHLKDTTFCPVSNSLISIHITNNVGFDIFYTEFSHLYHLVTLTIDNDCFTSTKRSTPYCVTQEENRRKIITNSKTLLIKHCPNLETIQIGKGSFQDVYRFELGDLPKLKSLKIGEVEDDENTWLSQSMCFVFCLFMEIKGNCLAWL